VRARLIVAFLGLMLGWASQARAADSLPQDLPGFPERLLAARERVLAAPAADRLAAAGGEWLALARDHPIACDWMQQDDTPEAWTWLMDADASARLERMCRVAGGGDPLERRELPALVEAYLRLCDARRARRLAALLVEAPHIIFTRHYNLGGSHYAYTEGLSDAQNERHFRPGSALCRLDMDGPYGTVTVLLEDPNGVIRDPDVSFDGQRVLFSWKKSDREDDYHLYEMDLASSGIRQLTHGLGLADYEGAYLPDGSIVFNSTRCIQTVDCWWTEVSNLYTCDADGRYLRRLTFDQVHDNYPTVTHDGRVLYTRWDYSDRGQIFPQGLFQMNPDGTAQAEHYGNNSWFPTTLLHARTIPGANKTVAIATGHHTIQTGKLAIVDPSRGQQEAEGVQLIAPIRETLPERIDAYGQDGDLFQYPYPLSESEFLVAYSPTGWQIPGRPGEYYPGLDSFEPRFGIYWMDSDGHRELLVADARHPCNQPIPLRPRGGIPVLSSAVDYTRTEGTHWLQDIYAGPGLAGVPRGTVKRLRVIALGYRVAGIRQNGSSGPGGGALASTPISIGNGCWDTKTVLGEALVDESGSAAFTVPARTPVYFQAIDEHGQAVQTMRSWSTLQPGERLACVGCHESKSEAPGATVQPYAPVAPLSPFYGPPRGFSYPMEIQPILDRHCTQCHNDRAAPRPASAASPVDLPDGATVLLGRGGRWRFTEVDPGAGWESEAFDDSSWRDAPAPFGLEGTPGLAIATEWASPSIWLRRQVDLDTPTESGSIYLSVCHDEDCRLYINGVLAADLPGYSPDWETYRLSGAAARALRAGANTVAVRCLQTLGGQGIDLELRLVPGAGPAAPSGPFSLLAEGNTDGIAGRVWSDSYLALTQARTLTGMDGAYVAGQPNPLVNWITAQSVPEMIPPYSAGSATSGLIALLRQGHQGVELSREELDKLCCWIDLGVPYCGDYTEAAAWTSEEEALHERFADKRRAQEDAERQSVEEWFRSAH